MLLLETLYFPLYLPFLLKPRLVKPIIYNTIVLIKHIV